MCPRKLVRVVVAWIKKQKTQVDASGLEFTETDVSDKTCTQYSSADCERYWEVCCLGKSSRIVHPASNIPSSHYSIHAKGGDIWRMMRGPRESRRPTRVKLQFVVCWPGVGWVVVVHLVLLSAVDISLWICRIVWILRCGLPFVHNRNGFMKHADDMLMTGAGGVWVWACLKRHAAKYTVCMYVRYRPVRLRGLMDRWRDTNTRPNHARP